MPSFRSKKYTAAYAPLMLGFITYVVAAGYTFSMPQLLHVGLDPVIVAALTSIGGLVAIAFGYESIVLLGGIYSLPIAGFIARITKTKQLLELKEKKSIQLRQILIEKSHLIYLPALLFFTSVTLGWDLYNADLVRRSNASPSMLRPILHSLNFFAVPLRVNAVLYSLRLTPGLIAITVTSGLIPSIALPYFRRFKIVGINSGPFHSSLLTTVLGSVFGLSILFTLLSLFYKVLWAGGEPISYHYALIVLVGLSLHYAAGTYIGRDKAEEIIMRRLTEGRYDTKRIVVLNRNLDPNAEDVELRSLINL